MTALDKFEIIVDWYARASDAPVRHLRPQSDAARIDKIEALLGEVLPHDLAKLFARYDGEGRDRAGGSFLGHGLVSLDNAIDTLKFSRSLIKPARPTVADQDAAQAIVAEMLKIHFRALDLNGVAGRAWHKLEFVCGPGMYGGPYLYRRPSTGEADRELPGMPPDSTEEITRLARRLHEMERVGYNWDELRVIAFADGQRTIERLFYDFNDVERRTWPEGAIKDAYFHAKWCPVIEDYGGNYIGVDLDPGPSGHKGQVIVFGRDEDDLYVIAESWEAFLDLILARIEAGGGELLGDVHLHDLLRPSHWRSDPSATVS